jgi:hypothetical protein
MPRMQAHQEVPQIRCVKPSWVSCVRVSCVFLVAAVGSPAAHANCKLSPRLKSGAGGLLTDVDAMIALTKPEYSGPGSWADADMLQVRVVLWIVRVVLWIVRVVAHLPTPILSAPPPHTSPRVPTSPRCSHHTNPFCPTFRTSRYSLQQQRSATMAKAACTPVGATTAE